MRSDTEKEKEQQLAERKKAGKAAEAAMQFFVTCFTHELLAILRERSWRQLVRGRQG